MALSDKIEITDLEFDAIKENLKSFLKSQSQFQDYDFEGSSMSVLIDLLAYNTHYMGYYANMIDADYRLDLNPNIASKHVKGKDGMYFEWLNPILDDSFHYRIQRLRLF